MCKHQITQTYLIPKNDYFNIYIQRFRGDVDCPYLHDHPWNMISILLRGDLLETKLTADNWEASYYVTRFIPRYYHAKTIHRLETLGNCAKATELVFTGKRFRGWGFYNKTELKEIMRFNGVHHESKK